LRSIVALALVCGALALLPAHSARAYTICGSIIIDYYSDPGLTHYVGECTIPCNGFKETCSGQQTQYSKQISSCKAC
jgi:hypothetical protein